MNSKPGVKIVSINLQSPNKRKKSQSPPYLNLSDEKQKYKQSIQHLKQQQPDKNKIFSEIRKLQQNKIIELQKKRQSQRINRQSIKRDIHKVPDITKSQIIICHTLFSSLIQSDEGRQYTVQSDLSKIKKEELKSIIKVVYFRKQKNYLFDFIFGLWDSQRLEALQNYYKSNF